MAVAPWEWGRLNGCDPLASVVVGAVCIALCGIVAAGPGRPAAGSTVVGSGGFLGVGRCLAVACRCAGLAAGSRSGAAGGRVLALWLAWLAVVQARTVGINFLLSVMTLVWMADIAAYFAGRTLGLRFTRSKLAPSISPGKSWEGVWGGVAGVLVLAVCWVWPMPACRRQPACTRGCPRAGGCWCWARCSWRP